MIRESFFLSSSTFYNVNFVQCDIFVKENWTRTIQCYKELHNYA